MYPLFRGLRKRLCRHAGRRVYDLHRLADGRFRARIYCPRCGWRADEILAPDAVVDALAGAHPDMRETMRRNLGLDEGAGDADRDAP